MTPPKDTAYTLSGRLLRTDTGDGVAGLRVEAFDHDRARLPQPLGSTDTDGDGRFEIAFLQEDAGGRSEGLPEPFVRVTTADQRLVLQTPTASLAGPYPDDFLTEHDFVDLPVHPDVLGDADEDYADTGEGGETAGSPGAGLGKSPEPKDPSHAVGTNTYHGSKGRDYVAPHSPFYRGPFGRLFRQVPAWVPPGTTDRDKERNIRAIAAAMLESAADARDPDRDNPRIPAGYTYFGQFVDHDVTFDPASSLTKQNDPERLHNFRTPRFDLDNLYGEGPDDEPFLYDNERGPDGRRVRPGRFLIGEGPNPEEDDLPRNRQGVALVGDPRNDENLIVAQLQLAFLKLHNAVVARVEDEEHLKGRAAFHRAQNVVRWLYQWVVLFDYLPRTCGPDLVQVDPSDDPEHRAKAVLRPRHESEGPGHPFVMDTRFYGYKEAPFMPVEFSVAAYRLGHSQIRDRYDLNDVVRGVPIFRARHVNPGALQDLRGGRPLPDRWSMDWRRFFELDDGPTQLTRKLDPRLSHALGSIPAGPDPTVGSPLAELNLLRGFRMGLPSGQAVARAMGVEPLTNDEVGLDDASAGPEAPLWAYVLGEADHLHDGAHLGPVGGRIVAEVFVGLAEGDPNSFLNVDPTWTPATAIAGDPLIDPLGNHFELRDLLRAADLDGAPF